MSIKKIKKIIQIYCEGISEKNYFEALKGNNTISESYVLKPNSSEKDLNNAIKKYESEKPNKESRLSGVDIIGVFVYDSDTFNLGLKIISEKIEKYKEQIYFSEENFEDFLRCHKTTRFYRDRKPHLSRELIEEIRNLDSEYVRRNLNKPNRFSDFKSIRFINRII